MTDEELLRYSRHVLLEEIGVEGQERIAAARAVVVGAGGLGSPVSLYLATAGVGEVTLVDGDTVDLTNLQRQLAHAMDRLGQPKVESARQAMHALNPGVRVRTVARRADDALLRELAAGASVVVDCTDNFATRHAINAACVQAGAPLVSGSAIRFDGQLSVHDPRDPACPCYACVFPPTDAFEETRCATMGVFAPLVGIVGSMQAAEALKLITGAGQSLRGRLLMLEALEMRWTEIRVARQPRCPVCGMR